MTIHDLVDDLDPELERRLRSIVDARSGLVAGMTTPDPASIRMRRQSVLRPVSGGRRRRALVAAAVLLAGGVGAAVLADGGADEARVRVDPAATSAPTVPAAPVGGFVVDGWEAVVRHETDPLDAMTAGYIEVGEQQQERRASYVLGRDRPEVLAEVMDQGVAPAGLGLPLGVSSIVVDGLSGHVQTFQGATVMDVALRSGLILRIDSVDVDQATLETLVGAIDREDGSLVDDVLPSGWREYDGHRGLSSLGRSVGPSAGRIGAVTLQRVGDPDLAPRGFSWMDDDDPVGVVDTLEELWGGNRVDIGGRPGVWVLTGNTRMLVWVLDEGHLAWISTVERPDVTTDTDLAEAMAKSVRRADADEWARVVALASPLRWNPIALDALPSDATVIDRGSTALADWEVAFDPGAAAALFQPVADAVGPGAYRVRFQGRWSNVDRLIVPTHADWTANPPVASRMPRLFVVTAAVPADVTGLTFEVGGQTTEATVVPVEEGRVQLAFATFPTEDLGSDLVIALIGQHSDGSPYRSETRW